MKITLELSDSQLADLLYRSSLDLKSQDPSVCTGFGIKYTKAVNLITENIKDKKTLEEILQLLTEYIDDMQMFHSKIGIHTGLNLARGNIDIG